MGGGGAKLAADEQFLKIELTLLKGDFSIETSFTLGQLKRFEVLSTN
ncbi:hypothetical protein [Oryzicola mucosus]|uniref:Uncharacterized protein n=1 Tax=Oryzicola mucosus TaxID=2767425 RepID=A0A8J6PK90_9HYPH|nr:hypothetical protein [Oryzicola mucosus]MBD0415146.1 hypothetical protein [Oryzicola mucosus]